MTRNQAYARVVATFAGALLLLAGTLWGSDDHFPFGPFRMYAGVNLPDAPAPDPRVEATDVTGAVVLLDQRTTGIRRADVEGQLERYAADPSLLRDLATAYTRQHPGAPHLVEVRLVQRWHEIRANRVTGRRYEEVIARWRVP